MGNYNKMEREPPRASGAPIVAASVEIICLLQRGGKELGTCSGARDHSVARILSGRERRYEMSVAKTRARC